MAEVLFAVIFEGRTGSSELMARLNSHPSVQAYPEILAPLCGLGRDLPSRSEAMNSVIEGLDAGTDVATFAAEYSKSGSKANDSPIRGFKTRLNVEADRGWFERVGRSENLYLVEPDILLPLLQRSNFRLIRLARRDIVRHAVSWLRAIHLARLRQNLWNIRSGSPGLGPIFIHPETLAHTIAWLGVARARHDDAYESYSGGKLSVFYEDLFSGSDETMGQLLEFLGAAPVPLASFHERLTDEDLSRSIENYSQVAEYMRSWGMGHSFG